MPRRSTRRQEQASAQQKIKHRLLEGVQDDEDGSRSGGDDDDDDELRRSSRRTKNNIESSASRRISEENVLSSEESLSFDESKYNKAEAKDDDFYESSSSAEESLDFVADEPQVKVTPRTRKGRVGRNRKRRTTPRLAQKRKEVLAARKNAKKHSSDEEYEPTAPRVARKRKQTTRAARKKAKNQSSDEEYEPTALGRETFRTPTRRKRNSDGSPVLSPRGARTSASKAKEKIHEIASDESELSHEEEESPMPMIRSRHIKNKLKKEDEDDEDYNVSSEQALSSSSEDEADDYVEEDNEINTSTVANNADNMSFCTDDASSDNKSNRDKKPASVRTPPLNIRYSRGKRNASASVDRGSSFSSDEASVSEFKTASGRITKSPSKPPLCNSTEDVLTLEPLPKLHVCCVMPDGKFRQCFALETLHKVAICTSSKVYGADGKETFAQPPHFRAPMSDDLLDQIASRFGRPALEIHGDFYNRDKKASEENAEEGYELNFDVMDFDETDFRGRVESYLSNQMGGTDLYCCPLCYIESHGRLTGDIQPNDDAPETDESNPNNDIDIQERFDFKFDPMTVLGSIDDDEFQIASCFCFKTIAQVKRHLREAHYVDTKVLASNDLFPRFKIRMSDGLLQRFLQKKSMSVSRQGEMSRYWNMGHNSSFIYLTYLVECRLSREDGHSENNVAFDEDSDRSAGFFFDSFAIRATSTWDVLSEPYRKLQLGEIDDFIVGDDEVEEEELDEEPHSDGPEPDVPDAQEKMVEELRRIRKEREARRGSSSRRDSGGESGSESGSESEELIELSTSGCDEDDEDNAKDETEDADVIDSSEDGEQEDEWLKSKRNLPSKKSRKSARRSETTAGVFLTKTGITKTHRRIIDSDDE